MAKNDKSSPLIEALKEWVVSPKYPDCFGFWEDDVFRIVGKVDRWDGWKDRVAGIVADHNSRIATETTEPDAAKKAPATPAPSPIDAKGMREALNEVRTNGEWTNGDQSGEWKISKEVYGLVCDTLDALPTPAREIDREKIAQLIAHGRNLALIYGSHDCGNVSKALNSMADELERMTRM